MNQQQPDQKPPLYSDLIMRPTSASLAVPPTNSTQGPSLDVLGAAQYYKLLAPRIGYHHPCKEVLSKL